MPAYVVFTDNTLIAIAETLPTDDAALVAIPGIGARKLEQFGPTCWRWSEAANDRKDRAKPQVRKSLVRTLLGSSLETAPDCDLRERRVLTIMANINAFTGVGVAGMSRTLHVPRPPPPRRIPHSRRRGPLLPLRRRASAVPPPRLSRPWIGAPPR